MSSISNLFEPPKAQETTIGGPTVTPWAEWQFMIDDHYTPAGWTFCKFGVRGAEREQCAEVLGIVKNGYGVYHCRFFAHQPFTNLSGEKYLAVAVHARSGYAIGVFADMPAAVQATEIAMRLSQQDRLALDPDQPDAFGALAMLHQALGAAGYSAGNVICRPMQGDTIVPGAPIPVWMVSVIAGAPAEVKPS